MSQTHGLYGMVIAIAGSGTLSTYAWVNMVIFYLQTRNPPILPVLQQYERPENADQGYFYEDVSKLTGFGYANHESLGALLYGFFK
jgi:DNA polymerase sigma